MTKELFKRLIEKFQAGTLTQEEKAQLAAFIHAADQQHELERFIDESFAGTTVQQGDQEILELIYQQILLAKSPHQEPGKEAKPALVRKFIWKRSLSTFRRIAIAASIVGLLLVAGYFLVRSRETPVSSQKSVARSQDVGAPQTNRAMITLSDGKKVFLDSVANGTLAMQNNVSLVKTADGKIEYSSELKVQSSESGVSGRESSDVNRQTAYNTLTNPRGSKVIDMIFSDGSHVWLNAGSSITYPVAFPAISGTGAGNERKVTMTGEAYFEVKHDASKPFLVVANGVEVHDLGTSFNVNAYEDEREIKVTLLEGSVRVSNNGQSVMIKPGEQASITGNQQPVTSNQVDLEQVMAWKDGWFEFDNLSLEVIMRQLHRWYNVNVVYEGKTVNTVFGGRLSNQQPLSRVLEMLKQYGVSCRIEGNNLIVQ